MSDAQTIQFQFGDGRAPEAVVFKLDPSHRKLLTAFHRDALALESVVQDLGPDAVRFSISAKKGDAVVLTKMEPSVLQRAALLHHLRPFVLEKEPYSFYKAKGIVDRSSTSPFLRARLKDIKSLFAGDRLRSQVVLSRGDVIINSEAMLKRWLNSFEYHKSLSKAEALEDALGGLPLDSSRPIFLMLLVQKAQAVLHLGHIVGKMMAADSAGAAQDV